MNVECDFFCDFQTLCLIEKVLFIADPPSPPQIHGDLRAEQKSGDKVKLTCSTDGGNPLPTLTWLRNDIPLRERSILEKGKKTTEVRRTEEKSVIFSRK